jgi:tyrosyl-tRNA synthetase
VLKPEEQFDIIKRGSVEILVAEELLEKLERAFKKQIPLQVKAGFDPTAPDIHIGHTVLLEKMRQFQELGHEIIFIIGDFTGIIGDPTGRSEIRKPLTKEEVLQNAETYKEQVFKVLEPDKTSIRFNSEWLEKMNTIDFARLGSMQTVARMLEREDFKKRFDNQQDVFLKSDIEIGGTDQKFNLLMGRTMQKRMGVGEQVVITMPLLEGLDGVNKMSKSLGNYIGITEEPKDIYGKVMSISDELMLRYYELLSRISIDELRDLKQSIQAGSTHPKKAKERLALEIVDRYHGKEASIGARDEFEHVFKDKGLPDEIATVILEVKTSGKIKINWIPKIMKDNNLAKSTSEAIRLIRQGAVSINGKKWDNPDKMLNPGEEYLLKAGKRRFLKIILKR